MAKFYSILQVGSGTLGNQYLRRTRAANGKEINVLANKNFTPKNPKTVSQMVHRARFANAVKFYKRAVSNFFKFAYEDKKANESDYNAFMRHNVNRAVAMVKAQSDSSAYPAMAKYFQLTEGSLPTINQAWNTISGTEYFTFGNNAAIDKAPSTIGEMSTQLVNMGFSAGQIFTLVVVYSTRTVSDFRNYSSDDIGAMADVPVWNISQFIIDTADTTALSSVHTVGSNYLSGIGMQNVNSVPNYAVGFDGSTIVAAAAIVTENVTDSSKLKCATSYLLGNSLYDDALEVIKSDSYYTQVLTSWNADTTTAILKGGLAGGTRSGSSVVLSPTITQVNGTAIPATLSDDVASPLTLTGSNFDSEKELTENSFEVSGISVTSLTVESGTTAKLAFTTTEAQGVASISYNGSVIATWRYGL